MSDNATGIKTMLARLGGNPDPERTRNHLLSRLCHLAQLKALR